MVALLSRLSALLMLAWALGFAAFTIALPRPVEGPKTDVIVVPTGGTGRIARGNALMRAGRARRMFISGAGPTTRASAIASAGGFDRHIFACCVDVGNEASDTRSNAEETVAWLRRHQAKSVRLVTTDWHMPRARLELDRVIGRDVVVIDDAVDSHAEFGVLVREYNKYLVRRLALLVGA